MVGLPGERLAPHQQRVGAAVLEPSLLGDLGGSTSLEFLMVPLAAHERPLRSGQQQRHAAGRVVQLLAETIELVEVGPLEWASARPVVDGLAFDEQVEAELAVITDQLEAAIEEADSFDRGVHPGGAHRRPPVPRRGLGGLSGQVEMLGDVRRLLVDAIGRRLPQPLGGRAVVRPPVDAQDAVVHDVAQQRVTEQPLARPGERRVLALVDQLAHAQVGQPRLHLVQWVVPESDHGVVPEHASDHGRPLEDRALGCGQRVHAGLQHAAQGRWQGTEAVDPIGRHGPSIRPPHEHAAGDEPRDELLEVVRVALGSADHELDQRLGHVVGLGQELFQQGAAATSGQRLEHQARVVGQALTPSRPPFEQLGTGRGDDEERCLAERGVGDVERFERQVVGPVHVLQQQHDRGLGTQAGEVGAEGGQRLLAMRSRVEARHLGIDLLTELEAEPRRGEPGPAAVRRVLAQPGGKPGRALGGDVGCRVAGLDRETRRDQVAQQRPGRVLRRSGGAATEPPHRLGHLGKPAVELEEEPGLPDARFAEHCHDVPALRVDDVPQPFLQPVQLDLPPDRRRLDPLHASGGIEVELVRSLGQHLEGIDRAGDALELQPRHRPEAERAADVLVGVGRDQHAADGCRGLQTGRPVDGLTDGHELVGGRVGAGSLPEGADDDVAGVDPDAHRQRDAVGRLERGVELGHAIAHRKRGANRRMRIVLARSVQPEHGHDGVTDVLLDDPTLGLDRLAPASEVLVDDVSGVLGVEVLGQHREVDEVGEQDRDQLALLDPVPFLELLAQGSQRGVDDRRAQQVALALERGDGPLDRRAFAATLRRLHVSAVLARDGARVIARRSAAVATTLGGRREASWRVFGELWWGS